MVSFVRRRLVAGACRKLKENPTVCARKKCACEHGRFLQLRVLASGQLLRQPKEKHTTHHLDLLLSAPLSSQKCDYECSFEPLITEILKLYKKRFEIFLRTRREALISVGTRARGVKTISN
jgi:hypothetical protein